MFKHKQAIVGILTFSTIVLPSQAFGRFAPQNLQDKISGAISEAPGFSFAGLVFDQSTGQTIFAQNESQAVQPASNLKLFTTAAALNYLGQSFSTKTSVYSDSKPNANGIINGDVILYGRGDPGLNYADLQTFAKKLKAQGIKWIAGNVVADDSYFTSSLIPASRDPQDLQWYYGAEISSISVDENSINIKIKPGAKIGDPAIIEVNSPVDYMQIINDAGTDKTTNLILSRDAQKNILHVSGTIAYGSAQRSYWIAVHNSAEYAAELFLHALQSNGIQVYGGAKTINAFDRQINPLAISELSGNIQMYELASKNSLPLKDLIAYANTNSDNLYAELILRLMGANYAAQIYRLAHLEPAELAATDQLGLSKLREFSKQAGIDPSAINVSDGSGLSLNESITPKSVVRLLLYAKSLPFSKLFAQSLPLAGKTGTLQYRFRGTAAVSNLQAKTGTLDTVDALSGYVTAANGHHLVFSMFASHAPKLPGGEPLLDKIATFLAEYK